MVNAFLPAEPSTVEPDTVLVIDRQGICHEYLAYTGVQPSLTIPALSSEEVIGQSIHQFLATSLAARLQTVVAALPQVVHEFEYVEEISQTSATLGATVSCPHRYSIRITPCNHEQFLCVIRGITSKKQTGQQPGPQAEDQPRLGAIKQVADAVQSSSRIITSPSLTATDRSADTKHANRKATILIVDDEKPILDLMTIILEESGYPVLQATSGAEALTFIDADEQPIDLLLSDIIMPQMSGYDLYQHLILRRPDLNVIFVSGYSDSQLPPGHQPTAKVAFLAKPFTWQQLLQNVQAMLDN